ncbi:DUF134 domain-containing protein [Vibrio sp. SCSIO 43140]|uniref:DUF134 domain-containing protein n=1 Tax=Vibrio sp. SCSIO 43140 TaxID=2819100 RepID=UPI0020765939|nr:DUF134 domain-containing protein [Vibrio sp. SCSIO 43140]
MARPKKLRKVCSQAPYECFKPNGVPTKQLKKVELFPDELEALRLADLQGMNQIDAAREMDVSRQTFANIVKSARKKVSQCLIEGQALMMSTSELD